MGISGCSVNLVHNHSLFLLVPIQTKYEFQQKAVNRGLNMLICWSAVEFLELIPTWRGSSGVWVEFSSWDLSSFSLLREQDQNFYNVLKFTTVKPFSLNCRLKIFSEESVPLFGPPLPSPPVFTDHQEFRDFLLVKCKWKKLTKED